MRAATVIVGAIAAASILVALAFILSGGKDSGQAAVTRTVTEEVVAAAEPSAVGGLVQCNGGEFTVEDVSCEVGEEIHSQYAEGSTDELLAVDEQANETITMSCRGAAPVTCSGPGGARVYFAP